MQTFLRPQGLAIQQYITLSIAVQNWKIGQTFNNLQRKNYIHIVYLPTFSSSNRGGERKGRYSSIGRLVALLRRKVSYRIALSKGYLFLMEY